MNPEDSCIIVPLQSFGPTEAGDAPFSHNAQFTELPLGLFVKIG
jgi:hypothetical protein